MLFEDLCDAVKLYAWATLLHHFKVVLSGALLHPRFVRRDLVLKSLNFSGLPTHLSITSLLLKLSNDSLLLEDVVLKVRSALAARLDGKKLVCVGCDLLTNRPCLVDNLSVQTTEAVFLFIQLHWLTDSRQG